MFRIQGLDHVVLRSTEPQYLVAFYRDVLGCTVERELNQIGLTQLRAGSALIDIIRFDDATGAGTSRSRNLDHFCLRVNPFDTTALRIEIREVEKLYGAEGYGPAVYLDDPDGFHKRAHHDVWPIADALGMLIGSFQLSIGSRKCRVSTKPV